MILSFLMNAFLLRNTFSLEDTGHPVLVQTPLQKLTIALILPSPIVLTPV